MLTFVQNDWYSWGGGQIKNKPLYAVTLSNVKQETTPDPGKDEQEVGESLHCSQAFKYNLALLHPSHAGRNTAEAGSWNLCHV